MSTTSFYMENITPKPPPLPRQQKEEKRIEQITE